MSFGLKTRLVLGGSVLGGDDLDGGASAGVRSKGQWQCASSGGRLQAATGFNLQWDSGLRFKLSLSLSLSLSRFR